MTDRATEFIVIWEVPFQVGELKTIGYTGKKQVNTAFLRTANEPSQIKMKADRQEINADGQDLYPIS